MEAATAVTPLATQRTHTPTMVGPLSEAEFAPAAGLGRIALRRTPTPVPSTTTEVR
jgi:hypothetical protein